MHDGDVVDEDEDVVVPEAPVVAVVVLGLKVVVVAVTRQPPHVGSFRQSAQLPRPPHVQLTVFPLMETTPQSVPGQ